jgi:N-acetylglucosaminyl-diphospho-decaprenol L-rhamnosyltransferase
MTLLVTAILVAYNSAAVIADALKSLPAGVPAIVVDNASMDDSAAIAQALGATTIRLDANAGFGSANNAGMAAASTPYVLFLNPDAKLRPGCLEALLAAAEKHEDAMLLVPTLIRADGGRFEKWSSPICTPAFKPQVSADETIRDIAFASGAAILARREALMRMGGFDPAIFLYFEDDDLSRRVLDLKGRILHVTNAIADHAGNVSSPSSPAMTGMKQWHMAWSERHVRLKHGLWAFSHWRLAESMTKLMIAVLRGDLHEEAKQRGVFNGTRAAINGVKAQNIRTRTGSGAAQ